MDQALAQQVLVLNRIWQPVNIVDARRAFALLAQEHARVVHPECGAYQVLDWGEWIAFSQEHPGDPRGLVHTVRLQIRIPKVLLLHAYERVPVKEIRFSRQNLFERDAYTCQYCLRTLPGRDLNLDHVIPRDRGGKMTWENIVTSCIRCNTRKANRLPHEAGMSLRKRPERPRWRPFVSVISAHHTEEAWTGFLHAHGTQKT